MTVGQVRQVLDDIERVKTWAKAVLLDQEENYSVMEDAEVRGDLAEPLRNSSAVLMMTLSDLRRMPYVVL